MTPFAYTRIVRPFILSIAALTLIAFAQARTGAASVSGGTRNPSVLIESTGTNSVVIVAPTEFDVVHNPYPQTTDEIMLIENPRLTTAQFAVTEAWESCAEPQTLGWLSVAPSSGTIPAKATRAVTVVLASTDLSPGDHSGLLCVATTDQDTPLIVVAVNLHVGALPTPSPTATRSPTRTPTRIPTRTGTPSSAPPTVTPRVTQSTGGPTVTATGTVPPALDYHHFLPVVRRR